MPLKAGRWICCLSAWIAIASGRCPCHAQGDPLRTGPALQRQLAADVGISWSNTPLRRALQSLSTAQHIAILLDRRVDPEQEIGLVVTAEPLRDALQKLSKTVGIGYCQLGSIAYLGPTKTAGNLRTLSALRTEEARGLDSAATKKFLQLRASHWEDLAEPRQLVMQMADEAGVQLAGADKIPHDLWPAADWPAMTWVDRLTILAAQFDLTFRFQGAGQRVELVACPERPVIARTYQAGRQADELLKRWVSAVPQAKLTLTGGTIRVVGTVEEHDLIEQRLRGVTTKPANAAPASETYQVTIENAALSKVVDQLAGRLNLQFDWDRSAIDARGISIDQIVAVKVRDAGVDELLSAVFNGTGLTFQRSENLVKIVPAPK